MTYVVGGRQFVLVAYGDQAAELIALAWDSGCSMRRSP